MSRLSFLLSLFFHFFTFFFIIFLFLLFWFIYTRRALAFAYADTPHFGLYLVLEEIIFDSYRPFKRLYWTLGCSMGV